MESLGIHPRVDLRQLTLDQGIKTLEEVVSSLRENLNRTDLPEQDKKSVEMLLRKLCARLEHARTLRAAMQQLAETCEEFALQMDFGFLYNRQRKLLSIGYTKSNDRLESAISAARLLSDLVATTSVPFPDSGVRATIRRRGGRR